MLVDTHAHLDFFVEDNSIDGVIARAKEKSVEKIVTMGTNVPDWKIHQNLSSKYNEVSYTVGIHPCEVKDDFEDALMVLPTYFIKEQGKALPVGIGEIGLDYHHLPEDENQKQSIINMQKIVFKRQLELAYELDLPICIHAREAVEDSITMLKESKVDMSKVVYHCYAGSVEQLKVINKLGARASFTGVITYKNAKKINDVLLAQNLDFLMFETDCPFLSPVPLRGTQNEPANIYHIAKYASLALGKDFEEIAKISTNNALSFYNL